MVHSCKACNWQTNLNYEKLLLRAAYITIVEQAAQIPSSMVCTKYRFEFPADPLSRQIARLVASELDNHRLSVGRLGSFWPWITEAWGIMTQVPLCVLHLARQWGVELWFQNYKPILYLYQKNITTTSMNRTKKYYCCISSGLKLWYTLPQMNEICFKLNESITERILKGNKNT